MSQTSPYGPAVCRVLRRYGVDAPIDVHPMVKPVDRIVPELTAAGADYITFHPEASEHVDRTLQLIREQGCRAGLAGAYSNVKIAKHGFPLLDLGPRPHLMFLPLRLSDDDGAHFHPGEGTIRQA
jgi:Ribulose-phosphate 3 epimerase family